MAISMTRPRAGSWVASPAAGTVGNYRPDEAYNNMIASRQNEARAASRGLLDEQISAARALQGSNTDSTHTGGIRFGDDSLQPQQRQPQQQSNVVSGLRVGDGIYSDITRLMNQSPAIKQPERVAPPTVPNVASGFAHAKDVAGRQGNQALESLRNMMTQRGISDSGMATMGEANILGNVARQASDAEYDAANTKATREWEANQLGYSGDMAQNAMGYQGAIAQRGQDQNLLMALLRQLY